jgi:asparagine synthase (glutamine-hydrolysing)
MYDVTVNLVNNNGFKWNSVGGLSFKGYLILNGKYIEGEQAAKHMKELVDGTDDLSSKLKSVNGIYSFVYSNGMKTVACSDRTRSFPLFYCIDSDCVVISDETSVFRTASSEINGDSLKVFLHAGYVPGRGTLLKNVFQIRAGEFIEIERDLLHETTYYKYDAVSLSTVESVLEVELKNILCRIGKSLASSLEGKTPVVPLSSGFDSRLIAALLKMNGFENVITFTYGRKGNPELNISERTAKKLGYTWKYIEYNQETVKEFLNSEKFRNYYPAASNYSSMFFLQEFFAIEKLKEYIPKDSVFIPGHSGDSIAGSHIIEELFEPVSKNELIDIILRKHFIYKKLYGKNDMFLRKYLDEIIENKDIYTSMDYQNWIIRERHGKFIINSNRIYEYFGYNYRMPLIDAEFMDFFSKVPPQLKFGKKLYDKVLVKHFFKPLGINFNDETNPTFKDIKVQNAKNSLKRIIPKKIINFYKEKIKKNSDIYYNIGVTDQMIDDLLNSGAEIDKTGDNRNSIIIQWYINQIKSNKT